MFVVIGSWVIKARKFMVGERVKIMEGPVTRGREKKRERDREREKEGEGIYRSD